VRLKRGWPLLLLIAILIGLPILEVWVIYLVAAQVGIWPTLATLVIHAVGGGLLMADMIVAVVRSGGAPSPGCGVPSAR